MDTLARVTWLFVKGNDTIRLKLSPNGLSLAANGPRYDQRVFRFGDEATAKEFLRLYELDLIGSGWTLQGFVERRSPESPGVFTAGPDRRRRQEVAP
jgi:hypothetical protein